MKHCEQYGIIKSTIATAILLLCALSLNMLCTASLTELYRVLWLHGYLTASLFNSLIIVKLCFIVPVNEELMRHISVRKGIICATMFPIAISFAEHFWAYQDEPLRNLTTRFMIHGLWSAVQYVGIGEKKPYTFLCIAIFLHAVNNLNVVLNA